MGREEAVDSLPMDKFVLKEKFITCRDRLHNYRHLSWVILAAAAANVILIGGKRRAFGIFITALHFDFTNTSMTELNWIGDSYAATGFFLMPFVSTLIIWSNRCYRWSMFTSGVLIFISCLTSATVPSPGYLFFTHTILHGIGSALILCTTALITGEYFEKTHRFHVLATAFVSGGPYGVLIFGPLFSFWIHNYGWRKAFEICGVLFLLINWLAAVVFHPKPEDNYEEVQTTTGSEPRASSGRGWAFVSIAHIRNNLQIVLWMCERLLHNFIMYGLLMNMTTYATEALGKEIQQGSKINFYFGIGESLVFTLGALVGDRIRGYLPLAYLIGAILSAILAIIMQKYYVDIEALLVLSGFLGVGIGSGNMFLYATSEEVMLVHGSIAFPMTKMIAGVGMMFAPLLSGVIIDSFKFKGFFISMCVLICLRVGLLIGVNIILKRKSIQREIEEAINKQEEGKIRPKIITTAASDPPSTSE